MSEIRIGGFGRVVEIRDGSDLDYVVVGECGHTSTPYTDMVDALAWTCPVCPEQQQSDQNAMWLELQVESER